MTPNRTTSGLLMVLPSAAADLLRRAGAGGGTFRKLLLEIDPGSDCTVEAPTKEIATMASRR